MNSINFLNLEYVYLRIYEFFKNFDIIAVLNAIIHAITFIMPFTVIFGLFVFFIIVYAKIRLGQVEKEHKEKFHAVHLKDVLVSPQSDPVINKKWAEVENHINSTNPSDWRLAILEADIMLDTILDKMGYQGESIGDKLKGIEKSDFVTLDDAWEAHKIRNQVAHEGSDFQLNERDAKRTIGLYKKVFQEFHYI